ncbi:MAG TPA: SAM-dependent methyltransferase [Trebonia sp.]|nr:SAM-dependent methyltransferase [Trebonia sp.]
MSNPFEQAAQFLTPGFPAGSISTDVAHPARMYDHYLGGRDNYLVDRDAADTALAILPELREIAHANRDFHRRALTLLAREHGIDQFLDLGAGLPRTDDTTTLARALRPGAHVVTVDSDPITITHQRSRTDASLAQISAVLLADLRHPEAIVRDPDLNRVLDLGRPVGVLMLAVLHYLPDTDQPDQIIKTLMAAVPAGSVLVLSHATADGAQYDQALHVAELYQRTQAPITLRDRSRIEAFFDGLHLVEPGVVAQPWWRPDRPVSADPAVNWNYGAAAVKP